MTGEALDAITAVKQISPKAVWYMKLSTEGIGGQMEAPVFDI